MATHSSILIWEIPWTEEPGGLQSMGLQRVRHDCVTKHKHTSEVLRPYKGIFSSVSFQWAISRKRGKKGGCLLICVLLCRFGHILALINLIM